jgi:sulfate transport system permease protein
VIDVAKIKDNAVKWLLILISVTFLILMLGFPLVVIIVEALKKGLEAYGRAITDKYTIKAMELTILATVVATLLNTLFGLFAAWAITKFNFKFKNILTTIIDLPFSISPIIAGLVFILTFGRVGFLNGFLSHNGIKIVFATPGIILATMFVTFPFVAREIIPLMNAQGKEEEEAAAMMGASGFTIFRKVTFPNIKWGLIYGVILCMARAMGEFGAVSVVSGHIRGKTNTLPLHVEILYNEYQFSASFAVASLLVILAIIILILRNIIEWKGKKLNSEARGER